MYYIVITGGVLSSVGKGVVASSTAAILQSRMMKTTCVCKCNINNYPEIACVSIKEKVCDCGNTCCFRNGKFIKQKNGHFFLENNDLIKKCCLSYNNKIEEFVGSGDICGLCGGNGCMSIGSGGLCIDKRDSCCCNENNKFLIEEDKLLVKKLKIINDSSEITGKIVDQINDYDENKVKKQETINVLGEIKGKIVEKLNDLNKGKIVEKINDSGEIKGNIVEKLNDLNKGKMVEQINDYDEITGKIVEKLNDSGENELNILGNEYLSSNSDINSMIDDKESNSLNDTTTISNNINTDPRFRKENCDHVLRNNSLTSKYYRYTEEYLPFKVNMIKIDPYLNTDAGTLTPNDHGEVFVLSDGTEVDLDLGNYERYLGVDLEWDNNITSGKIYNCLIYRERTGYYMGKTVQLVPHFTDLVIEWVVDVAHGRKALSQSNKNEGTNIFNGKNESTNMNNSKNESTNIFNGKNESTNIFNGKNENVVFNSKNESNNIFNSKNEITNMNNSKSENLNFINSKNESTNIFNSKNENVVFNSKNESNNIFNSKNEITNMNNSKSENLNFINSKNESTNIFNNKNENVDMFNSKNEGTNIFNKKSENLNFINSKNKSQCFNHELTESTYSDLDDGKYTSLDHKFIQHKDGINLCKCAIESDTQICVIELGGTTGDIESHIFAESLRQLKQKDPSRFLVIGVEYVPILNNEHKTKPIQNSVKRASSLGLKPDIIIARLDKKECDYGNNDGSCQNENSECLLQRVAVDKISLFCEVPKNHIFSLPTLNSVYDVPRFLEKQSFGDVIVNALGIKNSFSEHNSLISNKNEVNDVSYKNALKDGRLYENYPLISNKNDVSYKNALKDGRLYENYPLKTNKNDVSYKNAMKEGRLYENSPLKTNKNDVSYKNAMKEGRFTENYPLISNKNDVSYKNALKDVRLLENYPLISNKTTANYSLSRFEILKNIYSKEVKIGIIGKYIINKDCYLSLENALMFSAAEIGLKLKIIWIDSETLENKNNACENNEHVYDTLNGIDGILVPGGFGTRGIRGKINGIKYARENKIPFLGICLGFQCAVIEFCRNVGNIHNATSEEFGEKDGEHVIMLIEEEDDSIINENSIAINEITHKSGNLHVFMNANAHEINERSKRIFNEMSNEFGSASYKGKIQLGSKKVFLKEETLASRIYGKNEILERHRHRYEVNSQYKEFIESKGMVFSGRDVSGRRMEVVELPGHPFFVGVQYHPEFISKPGNAHPLFTEFLRFSSNIDNR